mmetsp:Transcript_24961/g.82247  ORF Transcript_24961/g.82247 Transcript_24961/m.82247 type:complete len:145 (+) Transcript_24961:1115-1549(+)
MRYTKILRSRQEKTRKNKTNCTSSSLASPNTNDDLPFISQSQTIVRIWLGFHGTWLTGSSPAISAMFSSQRLNRHQASPYTFCAFFTAEVSPTSAIVLVRVPWAERDGACLQVALVRIGWISEPISLIVICSRFCSHQPGRGLR